MILLYNNILSNNLLINYFLKNSQTFLQSCRRSLCSFCMIFFTTLIILVWSLNLKNRKIIINILLQHTEENMFKLFLLDLIVFAEPIVETSAEPYWFAEFVVILAAVAAVAEVLLSVEEVAEGIVAEVFDGCLNKKYFIIWDLRKLVQKWN